MTAAPALSVEGLCVEFRTRSGIVRALDNVSFTVDKGRDHRAGRRIGIGQIGHRLCGDGHSRSGRPRHRRPRHARRARSAGRDAEPACRSARPRNRDDLPEPAHRAQPDPHRSAARLPTCSSATATCRAGEAPAQAVEMLRAVGITDPARRAKAYPFEMSGGMCQRVMIAIALAAKPSLLIADEPTTGLDVTTQAVIMDLVNDLANELGMATIFITHDLALAGQRSGAHRRHACRPCRRECADAGIVHASASSLYGGADRRDAGFGGKPRRTRVDSRLAARSAPRRFAAVPLFRALPAQDRRLRAAAAAAGAGTAHIVACWNPLPSKPRPP